MLFVTTGFAYNLSDHQFTVHKLVKIYAYETDPHGFGYQTRIAQEDIRSGGWSGRGFGSFTEDNINRHYILPHTITTYMFQITARQMGLIGIFLVCILGGSMFFGGWQKASNPHDDFEHMIKMGALLFLAIQTFCGITRTLNLLPLTPAYSIPFLAYGSHTTIVSFIALGVLCYKNPIFNNSISGDFLR